MIDVSPDTINMMFAELIGFLAGTLGLLYSVPQILRLYRSEETVGVSAATWMLLLFSHSLWTGYGVAASSPSQFVTNVIAGSLAVVLLLKLLGITPRTVALLAVPLTTVPFLLVWLGPVILIPFLFIGITLVACIPQVARSMRTWRAGSSSVVSVATWALAFTSTGLWLVYAIVDQRIVIVCTASLSMTASVLIIMFELLAKRKRTIEEKAGVSLSTDVDKRPL